MAKIFACFYPIVFKCHNSNSFRNFLHIRKYMKVIFQKEYFG